MRTSPVLEPRATPCTRPPMAGPWRRGLNRRPLPILLVALLLLVWEARLGLAFLFGASSPRRGFMQPPAGAARRRAIGVRSAAVGTEGQEGRGSMPFSSEYERLMGIVQDMANRFTSSGFYQSEVGLKSAIQQLDSVQEQADEARRQEEAQRRDEEERRRRQEEMRAMLAASRPPEAAPTPTGNETAGAAGGWASFMRSMPFPEPNVSRPFDIESLGLLGNWQELGGNFVLRPPDGMVPKAVLHFLGGAFVGAAPHLTYRYLLTGLAQRGFIVVATPYNLSFDYIEICDTVLDRFEKVAFPLAQEYGALPVIGIGHSCGALLQVLITCLFPDTPRAANALISFNNRKAQSAIPGFEELVVPISVNLMEEAPPGSEGSGAVALRDSVGRLRENIDQVLAAYSESFLAPSVVKNEVLPIVRQALSIVDQVPPLLRSISTGTREFTPSPDDTREVCRRMYRARRTLILRFEDDSIDESESLFKVLQESRTIMRMKRPLVTMDIRMETVTGTHITPLTQDVFVDPPTIVDVLNPIGPPLRRYAKENFLQTVRTVQEMMGEWLEEGLGP